MPTSSRPRGSTPTALPEGWRDQLAFRYGHAAQRVLALARRAPGARRADRPGPARPARRGRRRRPLRAGRQPRRRPAAPHPARAPRRAASCARRRRCEPAAEVLGSRARLGRDRIERGGGGLARRARRRRRRSGRGRPPSGGLPAARLVRRACRYPSPPHGPPSKRTSVRPSRLAAELGIERYRMLAADELVAAILERDPDAAAPDAAGGAGGSPGGRGSRGAAASGGRAPARASAAVGRRARDRERGGPRRADDEDEADVEGEPVSGVLDITPRGHGFIRLCGLESGRGGRLRLAVADPPLRDAARRRGRRPGPQASPRRALPGPDPRRHDQRRRARRRPAAPRRRDAGSPEPAHRPDAGPRTARRGRDAASLDRPADAARPRSAGSRQRSPRLRPHDPAAGPRRRDRAGATTSSSSSC